MIHMSENMLQSMTRLVVFGVLTLWVVDVDAYSLGLMWLRLSRAHSGTRSMQSQVEIKQSPDEHLDNDAKVHRQESAAAVAKLDENARGISDSSTDWFPKHNKIRHPEKKKLRTRYGYYWVESEHYRRPLDILASDIIGK